MSDKEKPAAEKITEYPWTQVFIEVALRAIRAVHHDYIRWSLEQTPNKPTNHELLNKGQGIEFAEEVPVCAAISQEFINSRYSAASSPEINAEAGIGEGLRYYTILREFNALDDGKRVDLVSQRIDVCQKGEKEQEYEVTLIEAKRVRRTHTKLSGSRQSATGGIAEKAVLDDIEKLNKAFTYICSKANEDGSQGVKPPNTYLLLWNIISETFAEEDMPCEYVKTLQANCSNSLQLRQTRWLPLSWEEPPSNIKSLNEIKTDRALWVALVEIEQACSDEQLP